MPMIMIIPPMSAEIVSVSPSQKYAIRAEKKGTKYKKTVICAIFSAFGYLAFGYALASAAKVAHRTVFLYLVPFFSALIAYFWLGETLTISALIGGIIIIAGMVITNFKRKDTGKE